MELKEAIIKVSDKLNLTLKGNEYNGECPYCKDKKHKFYLNSNTGLWGCKRGSCLESGNINKLIDKLDIGTKVDIREVKKEKVLNKEGVQIKISDFAPISSADKGLIEYMEGRGISLETMTNVKVLYSKRYNALAFPTRDPKAQKILSMNYRTIDKRIFMEPGSKPYLWNRENVETKDHRLYITEGRIDALTLLEMGIKNVVSVPNGTSSLDWISNDWNLLSKFSEIVLCYDNDEAGRKAIVEVKKRLDFATLYTLELGEYNDINDCYKNDAKRLFGTVKEPKEVPVEGIVSLENTCASGSFSSQLHSCGMPSLDFIFGGTRLGEVTLITAGAGAGKTTLLSNMVTNLLDQGERCFVWSGELSDSMLKSWIYATIGGSQAVETEPHPFRPGDIITKIKEDAEKKIDRYVKNRLFVQEGANVEGFKMIRKMEMLHKRFGVKYFFLDNMSILGLEKKGISNKYELEEEFAKALADFMRKNGVHVYLFCHPTKNMARPEANFLDKNGNVRNFERLQLYDVRGSATLVNLASNVLMLMRARDHERARKKWEVRQSLQAKKVDNEVIRIKEDEIENNLSLIAYLVKNRGSGETFEDAMFGYDKHSRRLYSVWNKDDELNKNINWDNDDNYEFDIDELEDLL